MLFLSSLSPFPGFPATVPFLFDLPGRPWELGGRQGAPRPLIASPLYLNKSGQGTPRGSIGLSLVLGRIYAATGGKHEVEGIGGLPKRPGSGCPADVAAAVREQSSRTKDFSALLSKNRPKSVCLGPGQFSRGAAGLGSIRCARPAPSCCSILLPFPQPTRTAPRSSLDLGPLS